jgi:hypothetical protein
VIISKKEIFGKIVFYCDLLEKNAIKNKENGGIMLLKSRSVPVQKEA